MSEMSRPAVLLFARSPEREAAAKRMPHAAPLFRAVVTAWLDAAQRYGAAVVIACEDGDRSALARIAPHVQRGWIEQRGSSFGERVVAAAGQAFRTFDALLVAAIDAPPPHDLTRVFAAIEAGTVVIGPARDGGVNFIGLGALDAELLGDLTVRRCRERCARLLVLGAVTDLDSQRSLAAARNERAWRAVFRSLAVHDIRVARPRVVARHTLPSRAPPAA